MARARRRERDGGVFCCFDRGRENYRCLKKIEELISDKRGNAGDNGVLEYRINGESKTIVCLA